MHCVAANDDTNAKPQLLPPETPPLPPRETPAYENLALNFTKSTSVLHNCVKCLSKDLEDCFTTPCIHHVCSKCIAEIVTGSSPYHCPACKTPFGTQPIGGEITCNSDKRIGLRRCIEIVFKIPAGVQGVRYIYVFGLVVAW